MISETDLINSGAVLQFFRTLGDDDYTELKSIKPTKRNLRRALENEVKYESPVIYFPDGEVFDYSVHSRGIEIYEKEGYEYSGK